MDVSYLFKILLQENSVKSMNNMWYEFELKFCIDSQYKIVNFEQIDKYRNISLQSFKYEHQVRIKS